MKKLLLLTYTLFIYATSQSQIINTIAGGTGDGGQATNTSFTVCGIATDNFGNIYIADRGKNLVRKVNAITGVISTVAGNGIEGYGGDGSIATNANLSYPMDVAIDNSGNLYIADQENFRIRKVDITTGIINTVAGNGIFGFSGDGGLATSASISDIVGVDVDNNNNIYIADASNHRIRRVDAITGIITTIAGNGTQGFGGDGGIAINANLSYPSGVTHDQVGNIYIGDKSNGRIRKVEISTGIISTFAGNGTSSANNGDGGLAISASLGHPIGVIIDNSGNLFIADEFTQRIRKVANGTGIISTYTGNGTYGFGGDGGAATLANLGNPFGLAADNSGNIYIGDAGNFRVRKVNSSTGNISTVAGCQCIGDGAQATYANLHNPIGIAINNSGNIFISDIGNNRIRKMNTNTGIISTVVGNGTSGFSGDGSLALSASINNPFGISFDNSGNLFFADQQNNRIRKVDAITGIINTVAGNGIQTFGGDGSPAIYGNLNNPTSVTVDNMGNLYIADFNNHRIRKVTANTGIITTIAGNGAPGFSGDGSTATLASINSPYGIALDNIGNIFFSDSYNHRIRKIDSKTGIIITIAGNGTASFSGDGASAILASLNYPNGITIDNLNNIYIADNFNQRIRKVNANSGIITTVAGNGTTGFSGDGGIGIMANLNSPTSIAVDNSGNLYISDMNNQKIRRLSSTISNNIISNTQTICSGSKPNAIIGTLPNGGNSNYFYSWLYSTTNNNNGFLVIPSSNTQNLNPGILTQNTWFKRCVNSYTLTDTSAAILISVIPKPSVGFITNNTNQCININNYLFSDTSKISSGVIQRLWTLGNGDTSSIINPSKVFSYSGKYNIKLLVASDNGCKDSITEIVTVNPKPDVYFMNTKPSQCLKGNLFSFPDSSFIASGSISRKWYLGDGSTDTNLVANKSYSQAKTYQVKLVVTSNNACKDSMIGDVTVNPQPSSVATALNSTSICQGKTSNLKANTGIGFTYQWLNNNAVINNAKDSIITVNNQGNYRVITSNTFGCSDSSNAIAILVNPIPKPGFTINNPSQCLNGNMFIYSDSSNAAFRLWTLANGNMDTNKVITNSITSAGTYTIKLRVVSDKLCVDSISKSITVIPNPSIGTIQGSTNAGMSAPYAYSIASQANHTYLWSTANGNIISGQGTNAVQVQWLNAGTGKIQVQLSNSQNCSSTDSSVVSVSNVGIKELQSLSQLELYPNPNNGDFKFEFVVN